MGYYEHMAWQAEPGDDSERAWCQDDYEYDSRTGQYAETPIVILCTRTSIRHTAENGYRCMDTTCPCHEHVLERVT